MIQLLITLNVAPARQPAMGLGLYATVQPIDGKHVGLEAIPLEQETADRLTALVKESVKRTGKSTKPLKVFRTNKSPGFRKPPKKG